MIDRSGILALLRERDCEQAMRIEVIRVLCQCGLALLPAFCPVVLLQRRAGRRVIRGRWPVVDEVEFRDLVDTECWKCNRRCDGSCKSCVFFSVVSVAALTARSEKQDRESEAWE